MLRLSALISAGSTNTAITAPIKTERLMNPSFADDSSAQWPEIPNGHRPTVLSFMADLRLQCCSARHVPVQAPPTGRGCGLNTSERRSSRHAEQVPELASESAAVAFQCEGRSARTSRRFDCREAGLAARYGAQTMAQP